MAQLYFRYGAMGSSKTANALMVKFNYEERGRKVVLLQPAIVMSGEDKRAESRIGLSEPCETVEDFLEKDLPDGVACIIVDECQFLSDEQVDKLAKIVDTKDIPVICYGLRTDFKGQLFSGAARLFEIADKIEEIPTVCWCGRRAQFNMRIQNGTPIKSGQQVMLGGNNEYIAVCRKHYHEERLS